MQMGQQPSTTMNLNQIQDYAMNIVESVCSIVTMPIEIILYPQYGTRYFPVPIFFLSSMMMIILPLLFSAAEGVVRMIPFGSAPTPPTGLFNIGSFSSLYFFLAFIHGFRVWRRMIHMELEDNSEYEGPPLPFFHFIPGSRSYWFTRIVIEPAVVFIVASVLQATQILQSSLTAYLHLAALLLAMKNFIGWYRAWEYVRKILDTRYVGPIIAKLVENKATDVELAKIHLASFPKNIAPDLRQAAASHIARVISPETSINPKEENNG